MPLVATADTSREAWSTLARLFANRSRTRVMQLKETLTSSQRGTRSFSEFLQSVKSIADELALIDTALTNDDLTLHILNGLGAEFRDIAGPIRARESSLSFEELHDLLIGYEADLKRLKATSPTLVATANTSYRRGTSSPRFNNRRQPNKTYQQRHNHPTPTCQLCDQIGHTAKRCLQTRPLIAPPNLDTTKNGYWIRVSLTT